MDSRKHSRLVYVLARVGITIGAFVLFLLLRPDVANWLFDSPKLVVGEYRRRISSPRLIDSYMQSHSVRKLQLGAGPNNLPDWLNTDIELENDQAYLDVSQPFPLKEKSTNYIFSEHLIEHITYEQALTMLAECHRILVPGGKVRIATPNLHKFIQLFQESKGDEIRQYVKRKVAWHGWAETVDPECYILNHELRDWGHQFVYTPKLLRDSMERAGFRDIKEWNPGESDDPVLSGIERRAQWNTHDVNAYETMILQGTR
jgi:SAM-dependent methyltransferase